MHSTLPHPRIRKADVLVGWPLTPQPIRLRTGHITSQTNPAPLFVTCFVCFVVNNPYIRVIRGYMLFPAPFIPRRGRLVANS